MYFWLKKSPEFFEDSIFMNEKITVFIQNVGFLRPINKKSAEFIF